MAEVITEREIEVLDFNRIREKLALMTASPWAREMAFSMIPSSNREKIEIMQKETSEGRVLAVRNAFTPGVVKDIKPLLSRARRGAILPGGELANISHFIESVHRCQRFMKEEDNAQSYPLLDEIAGSMKSCRELFSELIRSLDGDGNVLDSASPELSAVRRKKTKLQSRIRDKLEEYIRGSQYKRYLQEALITIRSGRYVLPIRQEYRQQVDGIVHDQSSSGATLFIEPLPVVQLQNECRTAEKAEEKEIERILYKLSSKVADAESDLRKNIDLYARFDFICARGALSIEQGGVEPYLPAADERLFFLDEAVHPLLSGEKVPLTVKLDEMIKTLVITGPNTGGKTVALKTMGLLTVMAQCGLHVPAGKGTKITVFKKIRADIGDEQSIVQSLSTFSGHMKNIIEILLESEPNSMVLFDELGAGTDPSEGAALAMAILAELTARGALTVATTHINELKLFAQLQDEMQNAAMEFDPNTLEPTHRLLQGVPGQSNAFHIAGRLGLPVTVLEKARSFLHRSHDQVETVIARLVEDQQRYSRDSRWAAAERSRAELLMEELEKERELLRSKREDILREARDEAGQLIKKTKNTVDELIRELRKLKNEGSTHQEARGEEIRQSLNALRQELEPVEEEEAGEALPAKEIVVGRSVYIPSLRQHGEVISHTDEEAKVRVGMLAVNLPLSELRRDSRRQKQQKRTEGHRSVASSHGGYSVEKDTAIKNSIDLRGLTLDEAVPLVEKLLDNALWAGLSRVEIIHGKGTGKLKEGLQNYLKEHPLVKNFRLGNPAEGGGGVTVVELSS
ncbi:MAG: endonuclease MutS2 [Bacillota bacterium]|nr:endonuclease MutS2 [Bacillota bacterium]